MTISLILHPRDGTPDPRSRTFWSATTNALYIIRAQGTDLFGPTPRLSSKLPQGNDLIDHGRCNPIGSEVDALAGLALWAAADRATQTDSPSTPVANYVIGWLPTNLNREAGATELSSASTALSLRTVDC